MAEGEATNVTTSGKDSPPLDASKKSVEGDPPSNANENPDAEEETAAPAVDPQGDDGEEEEEELDDDFHNSTTSALSEERWEEMFQRLLGFKEVHGHCLVPNRYREDLQLGAWVSGQRKNYKLLQSGSGKPTPLTEERARRLVDVGFEWTAKNPRHLMWEVRFAELKDFKDNYGHAQVPIGWEQNVQLANWVSTQRQEYKNLIKGKTSRLNDKRVNLLNSLGFAWELQRGGRRRRLAVNKNNLNSPPNPPHPADREEQSKGDDGSFRFAIDDGTPIKRTPGGRKRTTLKKKVTAVDDTTKCILPGVAIMGGGNRDAPASSVSPSTKRNKSSSNKDSGGNKDTSVRVPDGDQGRGAVLSSSSMDQNEQNRSNNGNNAARFRAMQGGGGGNPNNPWQMLPNGAYQHSGHPFAHFMGGGGMGPGGFFPMAAGPFGMNGMNPFAGQGNGMAGNGMDPSQFMHGQGNNNPGEGFYGGSGNGMNPQEMELRRMQMQQAAAFGCGPGMGMGGAPHPNQPPFPVMSGNNINKPDDDNNSREGGAISNQNRQQFGGGMGGMPNQFGGWGSGGGIQGNFWNDNAAAAAAAAQHLQAAAALSAGMDERSIHPRLAQMAMARRMNGGGQGGEMGGMSGGGKGGAGPNMNMMGMGMNGMGGNGMNNQIMSNPGRGRRADPPADPPASNFEMMDRAMNHKRKSPPSGNPDHMKRMRAQHGIFEDADEEN